MNIKRQVHLDALIASMGNDMIKVVTGHKTEDGILMHNIIDFLVGK